MKVVATAALVVLFGAGIAATGEAQDAARGYAEGLALAASKEFDAILERQRLAQAHGSKPDAGAALRQGDLGAGPPLSWFRRSGREFQSLMQMLAGGPRPSPQWDPVADSEKKAALQNADASRIQPSSRAAAQPATPADANNAAGAGKAEQPDPIANAKAAESAKKGAAEVKAADEAKEAAEAKRAAKAARATSAAPDKQSTAPRKVAGAKKSAEPKQLAQVKAQAKMGQPTAGGRREAVAATSCLAAGEAIRAPGWYIVQKGDTLSAIAWRHYGSARRYRRIQAANRRSIRNVHRIHPCQRIYLPGAARRR